MVGLTNAFFTFLDVISIFVWLIIIIDVIAIFVLLFLERMDPRSFVAWLTIFIFLPFLGVVLYLFLGCTLYRKHAFTLKGMEDEKLADTYLKELDRIELDVDADKIDPDIRNFAKAIKNAGGWGYSNNNDIELITEGQKKMDMLFFDLRQSKKFILFQYYILRDDEVGKELMEILTQKVKEGVEVYLLTDAFGNGNGPKAGIREFKAAGGHFALFHRSIKLLLSPKKNNRNHRKIAIIDGEISYCGGYNIGKEYVNHGRFGYWRDASLRIKGGAIVPLTTRIIADWNYTSKKDMITDPKKYLLNAPYENKGEERAQVVSGGPDTYKNNPVRSQYLEMIRQARKTLYITTPYLTPDETITECIKCAAMAGVDTRIIVPAVGDHIFVHWNTLSAANELMKHGVKVYLHQNGFNHAKTIICDDAFLSVGSANMDDRSLNLNFETNVMVYSRKIRDQMYEMFIHDLKYCSEYSCEEYESMPLKYRIRTKISYFFKLIS
jgi:cardiolipin synthase A/B